MQYIELRLEDENGVVIEKSELNFVDVIKSLDPNSKDKYPWLWSIDPYGSTMFNLHQIPNVINELNLLSSKVDQNIKLIIFKAIDLFRKIKQHNYIRLIGD